MKTLSPTNEYHLSITKITRCHVFFNLFVNGYLANTDGYICLSREDFDRLYRDLFRSSHGRCIKSYSTNPPTEFYY
ncbi:hypothetical protein IT084_04245 [Desulfallas sp. Bu1-1]|uniref:hypothetical protein n=1 Tax=Desulfallas sp. Bu1-1 TaxID=2787620 RepID=UPI00189E3C1D|nr:hypothetical protein [Desulfallas sp. Bu1-1]MBF7082185.1 hypothetical protein [Desulfallas sp. Bu1-1]